MFSCGSITENQKLERKDYPKKNASDYLNPDPKGEKTGEGCNKLY